MTLSTVVEKKTPKRLIAGSTANALATAEALSLLNSGIGGRNGQVCPQPVALNATYHDFCAWAKKRNPENYEQDIIEMALAFWFMDDDWNSPTKVWNYFSLLKE